MFFSIYVCYDPTNYAEGSIYGCEVTELSIVSAKNVEIHWVSVTNIEHNIAWCVE